jgi:5-formyltetrahydrofolate cyclo-ligase
VRSKAELREWAKKLPPATPAESEAISLHISRFIIANGWRVVLTFLAMPGEVDLAAVEGAAEFAVTRTPTRGSLTIHRLTGDLERHSFGYLQPGPDAPQLEARSIEAVLVPGVLFAVDGGRLGHGKGYYDKLLSTFVHRPFLIGVTLQRRMVSNLPMTSTDVYMDAVVTEEGITRASSASG